MLQVAAREVGLLLGRRRAARGLEPADGVGLITGGMTALLAFVLALTLSLANTRFQERRAGALAEANAIGTAWLRAGAVDHARAAEIGRLIEGYAGLRRAHVVAPADAAALAAINTAAGALQAEIWGHLTALVREQPSPITAALMDALNTMFDQAAAERHAFDAPLPPNLFWLLMAMALATIGAIGFQLGLRNQNERAMSLVLIAMWTMAMTIILDLGAARFGDVRTSPAPYDWTIEGFAGGIRIPPLR